MKTTAIIERLRVAPGKKARLADWDPGDTLGFRKGNARQRLKANLERLAELQFRLYAENRQTLLVVLQAMDTGGKDGVVRHVFGPLNPQGCRVVPFKAPSALELSHDFLWRIHAQAPRRGEIGVFNRSHYEDVLIARVRNLVPKKIWSKRFRHIDDFERMLAENGTRIVKLFLHIGKDEQRKRLQTRQDDPNRHWKLDAADFEERKRWDAYIEAYEDAIARCNKPHAPWYIVPANRKWFRNLAVSEILVATLEDMNPQFPAPNHDALRMTLED